jgi:ribonucleases P/MRP protein subunit RPP40
MHLAKYNGGQQYCLGTYPLASRQKEIGLGIIHTADLKAAGQCTQACLKANCILGMVARSIQFRDLCLLTKLYKNLGRPYLEYGLVAWSSHYQKDKDLLERVHHRLSRLFPEPRSKSYEERLQNLQLWSLQERRNRADLIKVFKLYRGLTDVPFDWFFQLSKSVTRGHCKDAKMQVNTDLKLHFFSLKVVNHWNHLPVVAVETQTIEGFKM